MSPVGNKRTSMEGKLYRDTGTPYQLNLLICHSYGMHAGMTPLLDITPVTKTRYIDPCLAPHIGSCEVRELTYHHLVCVCFIYFCITSDGKQTMFVMSELHHTEQRYCTPEHGHEGLALNLIPEFIQRLN